MGTDIHVLLELKNNKNKWINCNYFTYSSDGNETELRYPYDFRNYDVFYFLQNLPSTNLTKVALSKITKDYIEDWIPGFSISNLATHVGVFGVNVIAYSSLFRAWKKFEIEQILKGSGFCGLGKFMSSLHSSFVYNMFNIGEYRYGLPLGYSEKNASDLIKDFGKDFRIIYFFDC